MPSWRWSENKGDSIPERLKKKEARENRKIICISKMTDWGGKSKWWEYDQVQIKSKAKIFVHM